MHCPRSCKKNMSAMTWAMTDSFTAPPKPFKGPLPEKASGALRRCLPYVRADDDCASNEACCSSVEDVGGGNDNKVYISKVQ